MSWSGFSGQGPSLTSEAGHRGGKGGIECLATIATAASDGPAACFLTDKGGAAFGAGSQVLSQDCYLTENSL